MHIRAAYELFSCEYVRASDEIFTMHCESLTCFAGQIHYFSVEITLIYLQRIADKYAAYELRHVKCPQCIANFVAVRGELMSIPRGCSCAAARKMTLGYS
jgi:hypothetical protein